MSYEVVLHKIFDEGVCDCFVFLGTQWADADFCRIVVRQLNMLYIVGFF